MENEIVPAKVLKVLHVTGGETRVRVAYLDTSDWVAVKDDIVKKAKEKLKSHRRREEVEAVHVVWALKV